MKSAYLKFLSQLLIFTAFTGAVSLMAWFSLPRTYLTPALPFLILFFAAASLLSFYYLLQAAGKKFIKFVNAFLLTIVIKLFLYAGVMIAYALINRDDAVPFMLCFFVLYLAFTIFESVSIIRHTRPTSPEGNG
jgi:hypothetical protein